MKTTCLVNNYNYADFVGEAISSVLVQTKPFDEIIIVDDGSTDGSLDVITAAVANRSDINVIAKKNEGQLSCFNEGFAAATGDVIFFLDADDLYTPRYLETALDVYDKNKDCDFLCCAVHEFGDHDALKNFINHYCEETGDIGFSLLRTMYGKEFIGGATSSLSAKRPILEQFLPLPFAHDWKISADDCLVYGSSLVGARKYCLPEPLVEYRVHGGNKWYNKSFTKSYQFKKQLKIEKMMQYIIEKNHYGGELDKLILREFRTVPDPDLNTTRFYLSLLRKSKLYPEEKKEIRSKIIRKYLKMRFETLLPSKRHQKIAGRK